MGPSRAMMRVPYECAKATTTSNLDFQSGMHDRPVVTLDEFQEEPEYTHTI
jgi:hypothetical protein